ncbi:MAG: PAS domain-containing protein [Magnetovibrio sp.]|nr:PAS domain-containing protein [Magnetovibrio sp.]
MTSDSKLKNATDLLDISSKTYQKLFAFSQAMICVLDADGTVVLANDASWKMLRYNSVEDIVNKPCIVWSTRIIRGLSNAGLIF